MAANTERARSRRVLTSAEPYPESEDSAWNARGRWPARWIGPAETPPGPLIAAYRLVLDADREKAMRVHVAADERYELFLNGERVGRGSERGDPSHWFFESYDLALRRGRNVIVARAWSLGRHAPYAQLTLGHGFLLSPHDPDQAELLATGAAPWEAKLLGGTLFDPALEVWGTGDNLTIRGDQFPWGFERGEGEGWAPAAPGDVAVFPSGQNDAAPRRLLMPAPLPPMMEAPFQGASVRLVAVAPEGETSRIQIRAADDRPEERAQWQRLIHGEGVVVVPAGASRRVLLDLNQYVCAYPEVVVSGGRGAFVRVNWQEALFETLGKSAKGNRDEIEGKYFASIWGAKDGFGDVFMPDGGERREFGTLWWQCGRYVEVLVRTAEEPITIQQVGFRETRYPVENESEFAVSEPRLEKIVPIAFRTLQMCSHETYMDCPFYEQLQYVGDTRLQALVTYAATTDDRLPRKALLLFDASRRVEGITQSRYPTRVVQVIPPFSLWWVCMLRDFALWRGDAAFVRERMPGARIVLDWFRATLNVDGLVEAPDGWNFVDWVPGWDSGMPPGAHRGVSSIVNRQFELALRASADLEAWLEEPELAARCAREADALAAGIRSAFWDERRGMFADDVAHASYSEHAQALALLAGSLAPSDRARVAQGLLSAPDLHRTTIYFSHYLFEAYRALGRIDRLLDRLDLWYWHLDHGLRTTIEMPEPTRSDCHAWGAHPIYHFLASILGARPAGLGGGALRIEPDLGGLEWARGVLPRPEGRVGIDLRAAGEGLEARIDLPDGLAATLAWGGREHELRAGSQTVRLERVH